MCSGSPESAGNHPSPCQVSPVGFGPVPPSLTHTLPLSLTLAFSLILLHSLALSLTDSLNYTPPLTSVETCTPKCVHLSPVRLWTTFPMRLCCWRCRGWRQHWAASGQTCRESRGARDAVGSWRTSKTWCVCVYMCQIVWIRDLSFRPICIGVCCLPSSSVFGYLYLHRLVVCVHWFSYL